MKKLKLTLTFALLLATCGGALMLLPKTEARADAVLTLERPALELVVGDRDIVTASEEVEWVSENEAVATVSERGIITAVSEGSTVLHAYGLETGAQADLPVYVVDSKKSFDDNILISVFWPPTAEYMNGGEGDERWEEQFELLEEAEIDYLCNVTGRDRQRNIVPSLVGENSKETNLKMAAYAYAHNMRMTVADTRFGANFLNMEPEDIQSIIAEYRNVPGVGGYYILDEPADPMPYVSAYASIKGTDPLGYAHLNFLPITYYRQMYGETWMGMEIMDYYKSLIGNWLTANADAGYPQDYAMFDLYPFDTGTGMEREVFFSNLNAMREVGLEHDVKTAVYLQSVSSEGHFRSPNSTEIRYEAMVALAFGYKQLSYFTWFRPTNRNGETFVGSIIDENGVPGETYDDICLLNRQIHTLGERLIGLDATEVYMNGTPYGGVETVPASFPLQPLGNENYTASLLSDKKTGRNYVMLVNNDYTAPVSFSLAPDAGLTALYRVDPDMGDLKEVPLSDEITLRLDAGDGILLALPEEVDYLQDRETDPAAAQAQLDRYESLKDSLSDRYREAIEAAVTELREALEQEHASQFYLDEVAVRLEALLDAELSSSPQETPETQGGGGCGGAIHGAGLLIGLAALLFAVTVLLRRRNR